MSELLSRIAVTLLATALYFAAGIRMLGAMQQCGYKNFFPKSFPKSVPQNSP